MCVYVSVCMQQKSASITPQCFYVSSHCKRPLTQHCINIDMVLQSDLALQLVMAVKTAT